MAYRATGKWLARGGNAETQFGDRLRIELPGKIKEQNARLAVPQALPTGSVEAVRITDEMFPFTATTHDITVTVRPVYLDGESDAMRGRFVFGYHVEIVNGSAESAQLMRRHWIIRHADGRVEEVEGEGVVGKQPVIDAGDAHTYNSFCILKTFEGSMEGTYRMRRPSGEEFAIAIPRFVLRAAAN